jgi:hypothetical protein
LIFKRTASQIFFSQFRRNTDTFSTGKQRNGFDFPASQRARLFSKSLFNGIMVAFRSKCKRSVERAAQSAGCLASAANLEGFNQLFASGSGGNGLSAVVHFGDGGINFNGIVFHRIYSFFYQSGIFATFENLIEFIEFLTDFTDA